MERVLNHRKATRNQKWGALREISLEKLHHSGGIRTTINKEALRELGLSMVEMGTLQPIVVRKNGNGFEVIIGHRRAMAAKLMGLKTIPAIIIDAPEEEQFLFELTENIQREELHPFDEARAIIAIKEKTALSDTAIAMKIGKSRTYVVKTASLRKLFPFLEKYPQLYELPKRVLFAIAGGNTEEEIEARIKKILENWRKREEKFVGFYGNIKIELKLKKNSTIPPEPTLELLADIIENIVDGEEYEVIIRPKKR